MNLAVRSFSPFALALFFVIAGSVHFITPASYLAIMPPYIPWPEVMVWMSGLAEILGGLGVCFRATRSVAGCGLIALLVTVFPANIQAISTGMVIGGHVVPDWLLWARLPVQLLFIAWVYEASLRGGRSNLRLEGAADTRRRSVLSARGSKTR